MLLPSRRYGELSELIPQIDANVRALTRIDRDEKDSMFVSMMLTQVQKLQETLHRKDLVRRYPQVHEVVSFLYLSCFSLLYLEGESFITYRDEVRRRYKVLLRSFRIFPQYPTVIVNEKRKISNL